jgi:hypothetical protein
MEVMEEGMCADSKPIADQSTDRSLIPVLDLANQNCFT